MAKRPRTRRAVTDDVLMAGRLLSTASVMFHTVMGEKQGLGATEAKALDYLQRSGPLTAGELATKSGLAAPSVTGLIDRLERKGFVKRVVDPEDRRRVRVELDHARLGQLAPLFGDLVQQMEELCAKFTVAELESIARFLHEAAQRQQAAAIALGARPPD
jgi:DNA-binding MarR family transcriptional regulator